MGEVGDWATQQVPAYFSEKRVTKYCKESEIPTSQQGLYDYHASGAAFERLIPSWEQLQIEHWKGGERSQRLPVQAQFGDISKGTEVHLRLNVGIPIRLVARHIEHEEPLGFTDVQVKGPFSKWEHRHRFLALDRQTSMLRDEIEYESPLWGLFNPLLRSKIQQNFEFRHRRTQMDIASIQAYADKGCKRVVISGATGLIGRNLTAFLRAAGHEVHVLVRGKARTEQEIEWRPSSGGIDKAKMEGVDAVIHLAGESIDGRWTEAKKTAIRQSRVQGTKLLAETIAGLQVPPSVFLSTSAVGIYGSHETSDLFQDETSDVGTDFLASVCTAWEQAAEPARVAGIRVVHPRMGVVLSGQGGALKKMLPPFLAGGGGVVGSGNQWMSWVSMDDAIGLLYMAMMNENIEGPLNVVSPKSLNNRAFTGILGKVLNRPTVVPLPGFMVKMLFGEMGETLLLKGQRIQPSKATQMGYTFQMPELEEALRFELGRM